MLRPVTRYAFAMKALPQGGKPFGEADDDDEELEALDELGGGGDSPGDADPADPDPSDDPLQDTFPGADPSGEEPSPGEEPSSAGSEVQPEGAPQPEDDARPWAGDLYEEGNETDPKDAFAAYAGTDGEQAWLDQASDGTLTGWVRDSTGQVWRYSDPDAWAIDVDDAQMTRTHSRADEPGEQPAPSGPAADSADRGVQDPMFASQ